MTALSPAAERLMGALRRGETPPPDAAAQARPLLRSVTDGPDGALLRRYALNTPPLRCFLWDLDGTVLDTYPATLPAYMRAIRSFGFDMDPDRVMDLMKVSLRHCAHALSEETGVDEQAIYDAYKREEKLVSAADVVPIEGIPQVLAALKSRGGRHYIITHRNRAAIDFLEHTGLLGYFDDIVLAEDGFARKPAPDSVLHILRKYSVDPAEAVMIGDRPLDTQAGANAGILNCLLDTEGRYPDEPVDLRTDSAAALEDLLCPEPL